MGHELKNRQTFEAFKYKTTPTPKKKHTVKTITKLNLFVDRMILVKDLWLGVRVRTNGLYRWQT